ncbi:S-methyl-5'-thioadenosine phosphorylase [Chloroflexota bacterium]
MSDNPVLGIFGGSGLYNIKGLEEVEERQVKTPFGDPSSPIVIGTLEGRRVAFLARHGIGHFITPTEVNYHANVWAMKSLGIKHIVTVSACGSLREDYAPGHIVVPDQLFDFTKNRNPSFFGEGLVVHVGTADPYCETLSEDVFKAVSDTGATVHRGGTFITIEGPRFSTRGESNVFRSWDMSIIGMTTSPEAYLAREAEMCYAVMAHVTDYDVWHLSEEEVTVEQIIKILNQNTDTAEEAVRNLIKSFNPNAECDDHNALASALITNPEMIPAETLKKLDLLVSKYYKS